MDQRSPTLLSDNKYWRNVLRKCVGRGKQAWEIEALPLPRLWTRLTYVTLINPPPETTKRPTRNPSRAQNLEIYFAFSARNARPPRAATPSREPQMMSKVRPIGQSFSRSLSKELCRAARPNSVSAIAFLASVSFSAAPILPSYRRVKIPTNEVTSSPLEVSPAPARTTASERVVAAATAAVAKRFMEIS